MVTGRGAGCELTGWGRSQRSVATVVQAGSVAQLQELVAGAGVRGILARGQGRSYGDAALNGGGLVLSRLWPERPLDWHDDGTVVVSAGTDLRRLGVELAHRGQQVPVVPGTELITAGGAVAADVHGKDHEVNGSFGGCVRSIELVDGRGIRRTVSPDRDADLFWATVGGMGLTGVITSVRFAPRPLESGWLVSTTTRHRTLATLLSAMAASPDPLRVAWLDGSARQIRGVLECAAPAHDSAPAPPRDRALPAPSLPVSPLTRSSVRLFNALRWARTPDERSHVVPRSAVLHPLDGVREAHRLYGPRGFVQYQALVPDGHADLLGTVFAELASAGIPAFLGVLKRHGRANPAPLSFPAPGWSLAVDLPLHRSLARVLDHLDELVAAAGGRVYLAKDSQLRPDLLPAMYPRLSEFRAARGILDPAGVFQSDLSRRLGLDRDA